MISYMQPTGSLALRKIDVPERPVIRTLAEAMRYGVGWHPWQIKNLPNFQRSLRDQHRWATGRMPFIGHLWGRVIRNDGTFDDLGLMSCRVVTNAGVAFLVDAMQGLVEPELLRFHGLGVGTAAEAVTDTALASELTTQYATSSTRPTGTLGEKAGDTKTFETVATISVSAAVAATEHGIFSQAAVPGGTLLDRSVFAAVNLAAGEALQATYQLNLPSGG